MNAKTLLKRLTGLPARTGRSAALDLSSAWLDAQRDGDGSAVMGRTRRGPGRSDAPCRDIAGRRRRVVVIPTEDGRIALIVPAGGVAVLDLLAAGRLRGVIRDVTYALDDPQQGTHRRRDTEHLSAPPALPVVRPRAPVDSRGASSLPVPTGSVTRGRHVTV